MSIYLKFFLLLEENFIKKLKKRRGFKSFFLDLKNPVFCSSYFLIILFLSFVLSSSLTLKGLPFQQNFYYQEKFSNLFLRQNNLTALISLPFNFVGQNSLKAITVSQIPATQVLGVMRPLPLPDPVRQEILKYLVEPGDSLWSIANKFNISIDTIIWANDLRNIVIQPGQNLMILPVSGVRRIVRERDTLSTISERYKAEIEKIIDFNNLPDEGNIFVGQSLIIPGGTKPSTISATISANIDITTLTPSQVRAKFSTNNYWGQSHSFPFGQCTWWVAQKRPIPAWGNANTWLPNARAAGFFDTCRGRYCIPKVGAVIVVRGNPRYGHVAYVEKVRGNKITFSEMNTIGWGRINTRTVRIGDSIIIGYIHPVK